MSSEFNDRMHTTGGVSRRALIQAGGVLAASAFAHRAQPAEPAPRAQGRPAPKLEDEAEQPWPPERRVRWCVVGLGKLALDQVLPAFGACKRSQLTALVSGDRSKAERVARQYGLESKNIYGYDNFDSIANNDQIDVVYIILPNSLHAEYTVRAARAGKHVLCEKPMATSAQDCERMIQACANAQRKLMIAYRCQYEPCNLAAVNTIRKGELGDVRVVVTDNGMAIDSSDPAGQWRLKKSLAGGGALMDIGIYGLNGARYLTGEEPVEVFAMEHTPKNDPRFREVEDVLVFQLRFPSGALAHCSTGYSYANTSRFAVQGTKGVLTMDPATSYYEHRLQVKNEKGVREPEIHEKDQFAIEMDYFSAAVRDGTPIESPGEEGMQDVRLMLALYESARTGRPVNIDWDYRRNVAV